MLNIVRFDNQNILWSLKELDVLKLNLIIYRDIQMLLHLD
jgi:hypothetical protein